jgi:hypothetical protein
MECFGLCILWYVDVECPGYGLMTGIFEQGNQTLVKLSQAVLWC